MQKSSINQSFEILVPLKTKEDKKKKKFGKNWGFKSHHHHYVGEE